MTGRYLFSLQLFIVGFLIHLSTSVFALESTGEGSNQRQALNAALRQAVEMSMGTEIESNTLVENFQVVRQQILSHTKGFVKSYTILNQSNKNGITRITIDAVVNDASIKDSTKALSILMKMAAHPRVLVAPLDDGFDSLSSLSDEFTLLTESVESTLREDFRFDVLDSETVRLNDKSQYRFTDRKNNLKRAKRAKAEFLIFVEIIKGRNFPFTLKLESIDVANHRSLAKEEINFSMADWTQDEKNNRLTVINEAKDHIYAPSTQVAVALVENLRKEVYEDGQRFELSFRRFDEKTIKFLETDLANLSGYVRHKMQTQEKNALSLSYWSLLKPGTLNNAISNLLINQNITFDFSVRGKTLTYQFDDPMFE